MSTIINRNRKRNVVYRYMDVDDNEKLKQKWDSCQSKTESNKRKRFVEYYQAEYGLVIVPKETEILQSVESLEEEKKITLAEFLKTYIEIYG